MRRWIVPLACLAVAVAALVAALLTPRHVARPSTRQLAAAYVAAPTRAGVAWASVDNPGPVAISANGTYWLAFRAFTLGPSQKLALLGSGGARWSATVGPEPKVHFFGPLVLQGPVSYWLTPTRHSASAAERIFYSPDLRLFTRPLAALPGTGFWPQELDPDSSKPVNWLNTRGTVDVASSKPIARVWLSFDATSVDRQRTLTMSEGTHTYTAEVPERGATQHVTVGPFDLHAGVARVVFSSPRPTITVRDKRPRTVRISELEARSTKPAVS